LLPVSPAGAAEPSTAAVAIASDEQTPLVLGVRVRLGGRYDDVRMCIATPAGTKGGPAADVSLFAEFPLAEGVGLDVDLPVMRPILFATGFEMLQFEPSVSLRFRHKTGGSVDPIFGPTLGVSLHYGPDYESPREADARTASFFALGPIIGLYGGLDFLRPPEAFNFQLGLTGYVLPLVAVDDPDEHRGIVVGGMLDGSFRFRP
jgi:hypothetical protein